VGFIENELIMGRTFDLSGKYQKSLFSFNEREKKSRSTDLFLRKSLGVFLIATAWFYTFWLSGVLNISAWWISLPFFFSHCFLAFLACITVLNNWHRSFPHLSLCSDDDAPLVAVLVPTSNEPPEMVRKTLVSVLTQRWPREKLVLIVGDDGCRTTIKHLVQELQILYTPLGLHYLQPPRKGTPERRGNAKDGNLNAMLAFLAEYYPTIPFVETRDADDLVGDSSFLQYTIGYLLQHPQTAYVQTIKDASVSPGDPFGNKLAFFYRGMMLSRDAANAVFPCGSGLVWRKSCLEAIGGFPTWNVVEDLYSGYLALQRGFQGSYLPLVGAVAQVPPEDIANVYKQLGTWALDTFRLCIWQCPLTVRGLTLRQRFQFLELGLFYFSSAPLLILLLTPLLCLICGVKLFVTDPLTYGLHFWPYLILVEAFAFVLGNDVAPREVWRAKQMLMCLLFVYLKAFWIALSYGPNRKPHYRVTRKVRHARFYIREVALHILLFFAYFFAIFYHILSSEEKQLRALDFGSIGWALVYMILLASIIQRGWYGVELKMFLKAWRFRLGRARAMERNKKKEK
jgi:cellulose synthase (UDP-forming)